MAEIVTLVIFALLLLMGALVVRRDERIAELEQRLTVFDEITAQIRQSGQSVQDFIHRLILADQTNKVVREELKKAGIDDLKSSEQLSQLQQILQLGETVRKQLIKASGNGEKIDPRILDLMEKKIATVGVSGELPSCWINEDTKEVQALFEVFITDTGILIQDNDTPGREADKKSLPLSGVKFGTRLPEQEFSSGVRPIFNWSDQQRPKCRFYVGIYDQSGETSKLTYKAERQAIEDNFYIIIRDRKKT